MACSLTSRWMQRAGCGKAELDGRPRRPAGARRDRHTSPRLPRSFAEQHCLCERAVIPARHLDYVALETWVRARLPSSGPFVLLGESFSGPIAVAIAANPPRGLCGLVLSTTFASKPVRWLAPLAPFIRSAPLPVPPMRVLSPLLLGPWSTARLETMLRAAVQSVPSDLLRFRASVALQADATSLLQRISVPTLCLRARDDRLLSRACSDRIASAISDCTVQDIEGPHLLLQARASTCAHAIIDFIHTLQWDRNGDL